MISVGDVITVPGGIDTVHARLTGPLTVSAVWLDGRMADLSINGRRVVSSFDLTRLDRSNGTDGSTIHTGTADSRARTDSDTGDAVAAGSSEVRADKPGAGVRIPDGPAAARVSDPRAGGVSQENQDGVPGTPETVAGSILAIDLMNVLARAYHATAKSGGDATGSFLGTITHLLKVVQPAAIVFSAEGGRGHRHQLHADYKSSRQETPDGLRDAIARTHAAIEAIGWTILKVDGYEADDVLATISQRVGQRAVIATSDKDLLQLAGRSRIIDPYKRTFITASDVEKKYGIGAGQLGDWLALCGDKSDDVPGVPGVGPKKATDLLTEFESLETILAAAYPRQTGAGKVWANIWQHKAQALLSRRLVELVDSLDLPIESLRRCYRPRAGWTDRLRDMGLSGSASRLGSVLDDLRNEANDHARDNLPGQPEAAGSEGDGATQSDSHADDSRSGSDETDLPLPGVCEAEDSVSPRPDGEQCGKSAEGTVQRDRDVDPDDTVDRPAWISDCVRAGFELTSGPDSRTGNWTAEFRGQRFILHSWCHKITAIATVNSYTLEQFKEAASAA